MSTNNGSAVFGLVDTSDLRGIYSTDSVKVGDTIKTGLVSSDPDHSHSWQTESYSWQTSSDNSTWNEVGTSSTYTLLAADDDKSIRCEVSYTDNQGFNEVVNTHSVKVIADAGDASFSIVGTKDPGNYLSIKRDSQDPDGTGIISYQWQISSDNSYFENASTKSSYKLRMDDANKYLRAIISYTDDDGFSESIQTSSVQISSNISLSNSHFTNLGFSEKFGTNNSDNISSSGSQILWGLGGNDNLTNSYSSYDQYLIGGSGNDSYTIKSGTVTLVYEAPNAGYDTLTLQASYAYGYVATLDNKHLIAIENSYGNSGIIVLNAIDAQGGIDEIYFGGAGYSANYFLSILPSFPGYLGNISWDQLKPYIGDLFVNTAKNTIDQLKISATSLENSFNDINGSSDEVLYSNQIVGNTYHLTAIRDYDGNFHANNGSVSDEIKSSYKYQGKLDVNKDGISEAIYTNKKSGRWVTAYVNNSTGEIDYSDHGKGGTTRIVGIYIDPLVTSGEVVQFSDHDSQHRFQNDLKIDNLLVKTAGDYDNDGFQEVYWKTSDGTAYLRALMHADGNIQYANYQNEYQMTEYLVSNGYQSTISEIII